MKTFLIYMFSFFILGCDAGIQVKEETIEESEMFGKGTKEKYVIFSPMQGLLVQNDKPLPNTTIVRRLSWNGNGEGLVEEFTTDDKGYFSLPIHEEELELGMLTQFVGKTDIEFKSEHGQDYLWTSSKFHPEIYTETDGQVQGLICDIESEEIAVPMGPTSILTRCRWKNMPK